MNGLPDVPLASHAGDLFTTLRQRIASRLNEVNMTPVSVLIWGPGISIESPLSQCRLTLRNNLRQSGHAAFYSEELVDLAENASLRLQQLAQAQEFDLIISIPCTPGSIAEIHDFTCDRRVCGKTLVFLNQQFIDGYGPQSLEAIRCMLTCRIEYYPDEHQTDRIHCITAEEVQRIREMKYILAGRY